MCVMYRKNSNWGSHTVFAFSFTEIDNAIEKAKIELEEKFADKKVDIDIVDINIGSTIMKNGRTRYVISLFYAVV